MPIIDITSSSGTKRPVTAVFPLPTYTPTYELSGIPLVGLGNFELELLDVLERIQQQLAQINNRNNLAPGERFE